MMFIGFKWQQRYLYYCNDFTRVCLIGASLHYFFFFFIFFFRDKKKHKDIHLQLDFIVREHVQLKRPQNISVVRNACDGILAIMLKHVVYLSRQQLQLNV